MELFLDKLSTLEQEATTTAATEGVAKGILSTTSVSQAIRSSPILVHAMLLCQERFVQLVAAELATSTSMNDREENSSKVRRIGDSHVQIAMRELGMEDILTEAKRVQKQVAGVAKLQERDLPSKSKRKNDRRVKQWSGEEIAEQERLLAYSKEKMLSGGATVGMVGEEAGKL
jgi:hypothetical protein